MDIHVCGLTHVDAVVKRSGARRLITLMNAGTPMTRPDTIAPADHLFLAMNDIVSPVAGMTPPGEDQVRDLIDFVHGLDRAEPVVIHCWAGISRSTAAAYTVLCALEPDRDEFETADLLRRASPSATPNGRIIALADRLLARDGRMVAAIAAIGRGADAFEGTPFVLRI